MNTFIDCIPCFYRQTVDACRLAHMTDIQIKTVIDQVGKIIADISLSLTPPELSGRIHAVIRKEAGSEDLYKEIKEKSNRLALGYYDVCKKSIRSSPDSLLRAVELAVIGNIIDFGVKNTINIEQELKNRLDNIHQTVKNSASRFFAFDAFKAHLHKFRNVIYLADNAGETVFDRILIEEIVSLYPEISVLYCVKEKPIINDALKEDALFCGMDGVAEIVSTGSEIPGTVLELCTDEFLQHYKLSDMIISKGQGNFESFVSADTPVFYLFMAKCPVVAGVAGCDIGNINLFYNFNTLDKGEMQSGET